ncbi:hypothetical protein [Pseudotenacibaculum haliotis]|uniref:DUF3857 domain-containing protein n=1 Tax=Pseudotenacibaculum haliotis TaxID=1862138 RepID=A0ABW5LZE1_9FLAO
MKKILLLFFIVAYSGHAQKNDTFKLGQTTEEELKMTSYTNDPEASAVVLLDKGNTYHDESGRNLNLISDYYERIKIFKKEAFNKATVKIRIYGEEKIKDIRAVTYNLASDGAIKTDEFQSKDVFTKDLGNKWTEVSFTLPNVKEGSVIEYRYSLHSPYKQNLNDWVFQSDIPKIQSRYTAAILANWKYNVRIKGFLTLDEDKPSIVNQCVSIPGLGGGNCVKFSYAMYNIPAFQKEEYMTSERNFISRLIFDLISFTSQEYKENANSYSQSTTRTKVKKYTSTWKDADKELKDRFLNNQTSKKGFFKRQLPAEILNEADPMKKAKKAYKYTQQHFNWDGSYFSGQEMNVKKGFEEKTGGVDVINMSLYNTLQALNIESYPVVLATRQKGIPTDLFPVINDFNYIIVKAVINGKNYFLDATDKFLAFGQVHFRCLNGKVRVLDFKKGSYWEGIRMNQASSVGTKLNLKLNEENAFEGKMIVTQRGYKASDKREELTTMSKEQYLEKVESQNPYLEIKDHKVLNKGQLDKELVEEFDVEFFDDSETYQNIRINPFFDERITQNPLKLKERKYPVDFGIPSRYTYNLSLEIPEKYTVKKIPEDIRFVLPNQGGVFMMKAQQKENKVNIFMRYMFNKRVYSSEEYQSLKEFFNKLIQAQNSYIEITTKS